MNHFPRKERPVPGRTQISHRDLTEKAAFEARANQGMTARSTRWAWLRASLQDASPPGPGLPRPQQLGPRASTTETGSLQSGGWTSEMDVSAGLAPSEDPEAESAPASPAGFRGHLLWAGTRGCASRSLPPLHVPFSLRAPLCPGPPFGPGHTGSGPPQAMSRVKHHLLCKDDPSSNKVTFLVLGGRTPMYEMGGGHNSTPEDNEQNLI